MRMAGSPRTRTGRLIKMESLHQTFMTFTRPASTFLPTFASGAQRQKEENQSIYRPKDSSHCHSKSRAALIIRRHSEGVFEAHCKDSLPPHPFETHCKDDFLPQRSPSPNILSSQTDGPFQPSSDASQMRTSA